MAREKVMTYESEIGFSPQKLTDNRFHSLIEKYHEYSILINSLTGRTYTNFRVWWSIVTDIYELYGRLLVKELELDLFDKQFYSIERKVNETINDVDLKKNKIHIKEELIRLIRFFIRDLFFAIQGKSYFFYGRERIKQKEFIEELTKRTEVIAGESFTLDDIDKLFSVEGD